MLDGMDQFSPLDRPEQNHLIWGKRCKAFFTIADGENKLECFVPFSFFILVIGKAKGLKKYDRDKHSSLFRLALGQG